MASAYEYRLDTPAYGKSSLLCSTRSSLESKQSGNHKIDQVEDYDVEQGKIFWLPPQNELPDRAVRRAHGKGAVEEGIYNHPVVVVSRPASDNHIVHFHLITSFQGKKLHEIYGKPNEFHTSRRSWYLPIFPSPDHPDANSKKSKKKFPTLDLAGGAILRWDSYVNLRHVYKIEWSYLRSYYNPETPLITNHRFDKTTMAQLLAKSRMLTMYNTGPQHQNHICRQISIIDCAHPPPPQYSYLEESSPLSGLETDAGTTISPHRSDFSGSTNIIEESGWKPPKAPPDEVAGKGIFQFLKYTLCSVILWSWRVLKHLWGQLCRKV